MDEENYNDITIKNICKRASISRQRFYFLFESKEEIIIYYLNKFFEEIEQDIDYNNINSLHDIIEYYFKLLYDNKTLRQIIIRESISPYSPIFTKYIVDFLSKMHIIKTNKQATDEDMYAFYFTATGLNGIVLQWMHNNTDVPVEKLTNTIEAILTGKFFQ